MSFTIDHPDTWIGVPERWPYPWEGQPGGLREPQQWLDLLLDKLTESESLAADERGRISEILSMALQRSAQAGTRLYATFEQWHGAAYLVESVVEPIEALGTLTLAQYAGVDDPNQIGPPFAEDFVSDSGVTGVRCYRYLPYGTETGTIYARADYVFQADEQILTIRGAELDLVYFQRLLPELERLAASVRWE